jgi:hypothetical protein
MPLLKILKRSLAFIFLTALTQVGGIVYLTNTTTYKWINGRTNNKWQSRLMKLTAFLVLYSLATFLIVPIIAKPLGRVRMPISTTNHIRPATIWTCLLNRNYVRPALRDMAFDVANQMAAKYPGTTLNYLDCSFPFINGFPLFPHLSHNDGKKIDLSFCYNSSQSGKETNEVPSAIGYGICEEPTPDEVNTAEDCGRKGFFQYNLLREIVPQGNKANFTFNEIKTKELVEQFASQDATGKIFIEPHLVKRLNLTSNKIRFHGCRAVRHDDHIHVQLK